MNKPMELISRDNVAAIKFKSFGDATGENAAYMKGWNSAVDTVMENIPLVEAVAMSNVNDAIDELEKRARRHLDDTTYMSDYAAGILIAIQVFKMKTGVRIPNEDKTDVHEGDER